ncbi:hypothetical protein DESC_940097 [Desulfosarcina cetonica]|uniref:metallophosphoesterase family protein n=1 Tax=Desulfosarcina cetonica TaxID=90730 RepID=UPI0006CFF057|nr:metallophosphoesterase [Desulfosarcina cetonica]VTR71482.1 hypothetical protein DESC_940097 [Desulfosarcina cetonica]
MNRWSELKQMLWRYRFSLGIMAACGAVYLVFLAWDTYAPVGVSNGNHDAIAAIQTQDPSDFTFAVFGDNKDGYALFDALLKDIDHKKESSFAVAVGDFVNGGSKSNYRHFIGELDDDLAIPLVTVIGNHDLQQDESDANYRAIFGTPNDHFAIGRNEFIILNAPTQSGVGQKDREWLAAVLENAQFMDNRFVFMHVPPFDPRGGRFHKNLQDGADLMNLFQRYHVTHLFAGHIHGYFSGIRQGVPYTITGGGGGELQARADRKHFFHHYVTAHIHQGKVDIHIRPVSASLGLRVADAMGDHWVEWGLLLAAAGTFSFSLASLWAQRKTIGVHP